MEKKQQKSGEDEEEDDDEFSTGFNNAYTGNKYNDAKSNTRRPNKRQL